MIPNETIDGILDKTDIVELISAYVSLKRAGQSFKARCPFHEEKTPSFIVSPAKQIYHCFGCGAGGNAVSFLMRHEKMDFIESIQMLADKVGVSLPRTAGTKKGEDTFAERLYNVNNMACSLFRENLTKDFGKDALRYFAERGINENTLKLFRLGFAEDAWRGMLGRLKEKGVESDTLVKSGLVVQNNDGGNLYDRFRGRIIFPIFDARSRVLGFGARALDNSLPKYINSPETHIYRKGAQFYGLNFAKDHIRTLNYVVLVEGYFDLILPFQNGIKNIVATLGTALTVQQIRALKRFTRNAIMIYDADRAGEEATLRSLDLLVTEEMDVRIAILPKGSDPDSFVRREGKAGFTRILKESKDLFDYKLGVLTSRFKIDDPRGKARIAGGMLPTIARIKNAVLKSAYLRKISDRLSIDEESLRSELRKIKPDASNPYAAISNLPDKKRHQGNFTEKTLLSIALDDSECFDMIESELSLSALKDVTIQGILRKISEFRKNGRRITPSHLISSFGDGIEGDVISEAINLGQSIADKKRTLNDCFRHIRKQDLHDRLKNIRFKIQDAESSSDFEAIKKLMREYNELIKTFEVKVEVQEKK